MSITTASIITLVRALLDDNLRTDGQDFYGYDADSSFKLSEEHIASATINVYQNGTLLPSTEWTYNSDTNKIAVSFTLSGYSLTKGDNIIVSYNFYDRFSDSELTNYINAALPEFTKRKYKKLLYMNSSNEIVTLNGVNPTLEEGHLIALVTAIRIDPRNVKISTRDWSISSEETMSRTQQLDELFKQVQIFLGSFSIYKEDV